VGSAHTRKLFEKSLNKNFEKIAKSTRFLDKYYSSKCACAFYKVFASLFSKSEWEFEGKALKVLKINFRATNTSHLQKTPNKINYLQTNTKDKHTWTFYSKT